MAKSVFQEHAEQWQPEQSELEALRKHEPGVEFTVVAPRGMSEGRHSRVSILEYKIGTDNRRVLWKRMGRGKGLTRSEAEHFESRLRPYRQSLVDGGWNLPLLFHIQSVHGHESEIFSYEELIADGDTEYVLLDPAQPMFRKWWLLERTLETLARYPDKALKRERIAGKELSRLPHGLDLKPANLVLNRQDELYFVDLFGPKELDRQGDWMTYSPKLDTLPPEDLKALCATREGAILRFYRLTEMLWQEREAVETENIRKGFVKLLGSVGIPEQEQELITSELEQGYPWLDQLYAEHKV